MSSVWDRRAKPPYVTAEQVEALDRAYERANTRFNNADHLVAMLGGSATDEDAEELRLASAAREQAWNLYAPAERMLSLEAHCAKMEREKKLASRIVIYAAYAMIAYHLLSWFVR